MQAMCVRCGKAEGPDPLGFCPPCALAVRIELTMGFKRLAAYLGRWADFERWLAEQGRL
jgi:hypothetical protein